MEKDIPAGNPCKPALGINSAHCCSVYLRSRVSSEQAWHVLYQFRLYSPPRSKVSFVFPWLWKSMSTLLLCGFKLKQPVIAFIFCTHREMESKERRVFRFRLHRPPRSLSTTSVLILCTNEWLPMCTVEDVSAEWTGCTQENQLLYRVVMESTLLWTGWMWWKWGLACRTELVLLFFLFGEQASERDLNYLGLLCIVSVKTTDILDSKWMFLPHIMSTSPFWETSGKRKQIMES